MVEAAGCIPTELIRQEDGALSRLVEKPYHTCYKEGSGISSYMGATLRYTYSIHVDGAPVGKSILAQEPGFYSSSGAN